MTSLTLVPADVLPEPLIAPRPTRPPTEPSGLLRPPPTPDCPLLGLTLLTVEDSRFAAEGLRLLALRSGARLRRADSLAAAERHLRTYRPTAIIVDLHLPDGRGEDLIARLSDRSGLLRRATPRIPVILATSGDPDGAPRAIDAGADGYLPKPIPGLTSFQRAILRHLDPSRRPSGPRPVEEAVPEPDHAALTDDMGHAERLLGTGDAGLFDYVAGFLASVARSAREPALAGAVAALADARRDGETGLPEAAALRQTLLLHLRQRARLH